MKYISLPKSFVYETSDVNCWLHSARAVAGALRIEKPIDSRKTGIEVNIGLARPNTLCRVLQKNGFEAEVCHARQMPDAKLLDLIRRQLAYGLPPIFLVGCMWKDLIPHWVTLFGDDCQGFWIYSSDTAVQLKNVPVGNTFMTYAQFLTRWKKLNYLRMVNMDMLYLNVKHASLQANNCPEKKERVRELLELNHQGMRKSHGGGIL